MTIMCLVLVCGVALRARAEAGDVTVLDGLGDMGAISLYVVERGRLRLTYRNNSVFDSLGIFYAVISSTQGGWTWLSSDGRYLGATAYGDNDRRSNGYYKALKEIFQLAPDGQVFLNRDLANWPRDILHRPYTDALKKILGGPIALEDKWNPDAVLRIEDIRYKDNTQSRVDIAAATQMVFEDTLMHVIEHFIVVTGSDLLVLTGGIGLNALGNMRVLERFDMDFYRREIGRPARLHLWVPPTPNDAGVTMGAAYMGAYLAGFGLGPPIEHAFYCGTAPAEAEIRVALAAGGDVEWIELVSAAGSARELYADFMAYITSQGAIFALYQGAAETGPRALGHRSILANPCNPRTRENLSARVKYREAIRPLAPMMTLEAAKECFELSDGTSGMPGPAPAPVSPRLFTPTAPPACRSCARKPTRSRMLTSGRSAIASASRSRSTPRSTSPDPSRRRLGKRSIHSSAPRGSMPC